MSEIPALREALRDTARRKVHRRRRRLTLAVAVPVAAAFLAVALAAVEPRTEETTIPPTATPTPIPIPATVTLDDAERELAKLYGVFRRPARASDKPPKNMPIGGGVMKIEYDWGRARRIATLGPRAAYLTPVVYAGTAGFCVFVRFSPTRPGGGGCGTIEPGLATKAIWGRSSSVHYLLLPDGVERVTVHRRDGGTVIRRTGENGFVFKGGVRRFTWRDAEGKEHSTRATI